MRGRHVHVCTLNARVVVLRSQNRNISDDGTSRIILAINGRSIERTKISLISIYIISKVFSFNF